MTFQFGIDHLLQSKEQMDYLKSKRCGLVAHPASVTKNLSHSLDALIENNCPIVRVFGPQHGMRGDKQDNMIESQDYVDPVHQIPVVSLYSKFRYPTEAMLSDLDVILFDLQDIGCRIYTYIATLRYFIEACATHDVQCWVLDRPNPAGRPIDGLRLESGQESFVGCDILPVRHGLTIGELARWFKVTNRFSTDLKIIPMLNYDPVTTLGWPGKTPWVNPSPNASSVNMARCFPGTVLLEGTLLSEGRGTTTPLEVIGAPDFPAAEIIDLLSQQCPDWLSGIIVRPCYFEPTFHKHQGQLCTGFQFHTDFQGYDHDKFTPYRLIAGCLKALRILKPDYTIWRDFHYEYEADRLPIDVINGGDGLRTWVDDGNLSFNDFENKIKHQMDDWQSEQIPFLIY